MRTQARFPGFDLDSGGYESFYLRAVDPGQPRSIWLRHTVFKAPGKPPVGSIWATLVDASRDAPATLKLSTEEVSSPAGGYIAIGESTFTPESVRGRAERDGASAEWDLTYAGDEPALFHLPREWMYTAGLPKTKLLSPHPAVAFDGTMRVGDAEVRLDSWPGMIGHNWGTQHAERWIWLHGTAFEDVPGAWTDLSFGRVKVGPVTTPWIANGVVSVNGERLRFGGPGRIRSTKVREDPLRLDFDVAGDGARLEGTVHSPRAHTTVWRYSDPDGHEHHVANCSIAGLDLVLHRDGGIPLRLHTDHAGTYEIGMRETTHGLPVQPFPDP